MSWAAKSQNLQTCESSKGSPFIFRTPCLELKKNSSISGSQSENFWGNICRWKIHGISHPITIKYSHLQPNIAHRLLNSVRLNICRPGTNMHFHERLKVFLDDPAVLKLPGTVVHYLRTHLIPHVEIRMFNRDSLNTENWEISLRIKWQKTHFIVRWKLTWNCMEFILPPLTKAIGYNRKFDTFS